MGQEVAWPPMLHQKVIERQRRRVSTEVDHQLHVRHTAGGDRRKSALDALKTWNTPNALLADAILEAAQAGDRDILTGAYCRTVTRVPSMTGAEIIAGLRKAVPLADNGKAGRRRASRRTCCRKRA